MALQRGNRHLQFIPPVYATSRAWPEWLIMCRVEYNVRLGQMAKARDCFDRVNTWRDDHKVRPAVYTAELTALGAEAASTLGLP